MKSNIIREKSFEFALEIVELYKYLTANKEYILSKQLLRSGTSIGANVREAQFAESRSDFVHKLSISLKEANETDYWIDLLHLSGYLDDIQMHNIKPKIIEQIRLLTKIINSTKTIINC